jgi:hypothetical protein
MRSSEVIGCDDTAQFFDDVFGRLAAIERLSTIAGNGFEGGGQSGPGH